MCRESDDAARCVTLQHLPDLERLATSLGPGRLGDYVAVLVGTMHAGVVTPCPAAPASRGAFVKVAS